MKLRKEITRQEAYLISHKRHHHFISICRLLVFIFFIIIWEVSSALGWIDSFFFSSPSGVITCFLNMIHDRSLFLHLGITLAETVISFLLVFFISIGIATILWYSKKLSEISEPYLVILNSLPKSALAPLFIVWLGTGMKTIIVAGISVAVFGSVISFYTGFSQADPEKITLVRTLGGTKKDVFSKVILPGSVPIMLSTTKVNIGLSLVGVIIGEFLAARRGLGYLIIYGSQVFQLDMVITGIIILCAVSFFLYKVIQSLEHLMKRKLLS